MIRTGDLMSFFLIKRKPLSIDKMTPNQAKWNLKTNNKNDWRAADNMSVDVMQPKSAIGKLIGGVVRKNPRESQIWLAEGVWTSLSDKQQKFSGKPKGDFRKGETTSKNPQKD